MCDSLSNIIISLSPGWASPLAANIILQCGARYLALSLSQEPGSSSFKGRRSGLEYLKASQQTICLPEAH